MNVCMSVSGLPGIPFTVVCVSTELFLLDAAQRAVTQHKEQLLMYTMQFLRQRQEQHEDKKRPPPAAGAAGAPHRPRKKARKADSSEAVPGAAAKRAPKRRRGEGSAD
ncbi:unnamed protein product [Vitrella brassicaformis CCMP3155]|uniref:Uncharacterized protein n=1 Tax=Vitrella brassicaformis (strain CCMP3155) TaxID=1169540 RepID=A0A0G4ESZ4_VITBC|nr:unnamed protein product [Vitrella brassicaformis CCMP3155]|eukprot:CEM00831.1 unnamed protein product [Vitrella brassicaformis CCMP3155]